MGNTELVDSMIRDGLWDIYKNVHMGTFGDRCAEKYGFTREAQDNFAMARSKRLILREQRNFVEVVEGTFGNPSTLAEK